MKKGMKGMKGTKGTKGTKQKIAILGGGMGSMATAVALTSEPNWQDRYEITVYQLGWRLGGKGASGRGDHERIEEHGLHIWMGFYNNAFRMIQDAYAELNRPPESPLATWDQAFKQHSFLVVEEHIEDEWKPWAVNFPTNGDVPGKGGELPSLWGYITLSLQKLHKHFLDVIALKAELHDDPVPTEPCGDAPPTLKHPSWLHRLREDFDLALDLCAVSLGALYLESAHQLASRLPPPEKNGDPAIHRRILEPLSEFMGWLNTKVEQHITGDDLLRRLFIVADIVLTCIRGIIEEGVLYRPEELDYLDQYDLMEWLQKHGASEVSYKSAPVRGTYDLVFAFRNGEVDKPSFAAGVAIRSMLRICLTYKGAIFWKMQAGMGDTVFGPIYAVLKNRGVKFEFFHRTKNLILSEDKKSIAAVEIGRQVTLKNPEYNPLVDVLGLPCWPSKPNFEQLEEGEDLKAQNIDLESFWTPWKDVEERTLKVGKDFDKVVLGISLGSLPYVCPELIAESSVWQEMVQKVETVRTMAMQLWLLRNLADLGWAMKSPVIDAYADPQNTWADMSHLLCREVWPADCNPLNIAYFCGPLEGGTPDATELSTPQIESEKVKQLSIDWLNKFMGKLWPKASPSDNPAGLDWRLLADCTNAEGEARFDSQFWGANINPWQRYVLSVAGGTEARIRPGESGFKNLVLAGDWTRNNLNVGCVEATVMSGLQACHA
nr:NAD(P)-binding protein [Armatimonadota bacterium]